MVANSMRINKHDSTNETMVPLLDSNNDPEEPNSNSIADVPFIIEDEDEDEQNNLSENPASYSEDNIGSARTVRFKEHDQIISVPLRSTAQSRETQFDLDSDELDESEHSALYEFQLEDSGRLGDQSMPLLVGLLDSAARRSTDSSTPGRSSQQHNAVDEELELETIAAKRIAGGNMIDSVANMANSILGAGIIGLPYALSQAGLLTGLFLLVALCGITDWTIRLIVINAKLSGRNSYIEIMDHCFGSSGRAAVSFFQFAFAFGGMCAFGIIIGDTIPQVIRSVFPGLQSTPVLSLLTKRQFVIALCTICVSYPLSLYRDIHKLSRASGLALVGMVIIVISVLVEGPQVTPELKGDKTQKFSVIRPGLFQAIGVISFAFVCHHNSLLIYGSLKTPTLDRFSKVTHISTFISLVACCTLAISAFLVFTNKTQGNILNNFAPTDTVINVARFCFGLNMFTTLPLELFVCREVIEQYFFAHEPFNPQRHLLFTTSILFASMFISLITCDLGVMLELTGGVSATALAFIFPSACYFQLLPKDRPLFSRNKIAAVCCTIFGSIVLILSLILTLRKVWMPQHGVRICN